MVTLDEFQYLGESPKELGAVASELNAAWEMRRPPRSILAQACAYGVFGGTPCYLAPIDPTRSLSQNVIDLMLRPSGEVRELVQTALVQEQGLRNIPRYTAIMRAMPPKG